MKQSIMFCVVLFSYFAHTIHANQQNDAQSYHEYLWANYHQYGKNKLEAQTWYAKVLSKNTSRSVYKGYILFLFEQHQFAKIVKLIPKLDASFAKDVEIQRIFALALDRVGRNHESTSRILALNAQFKQNPEVAFQAVQIYMQKREIENAIITIDQFLTKQSRHPTDSLFYFLKSQCHLLLAQLDKARNAIKKSVEIQSHFDRGWLFLALLEEQAGQIDDAIQGYTRFLEITNLPKQQIQQHVFELSLKNKKNSSFTALSPKEWFYKAQEAFGKKEYAQAEQYLLKASPIAPEDTLAHHSLHIEIFIKTNRLTDALSLIQKEALKGDPQDSTWLKMLHLIAQDNPQEPVFKVFSAITPHYKKNAWLYLYQADIHMRLHAHQKAIQLLTDAEVYIKGNTLKAKTLFQKAVLLYELATYEPMIECLEKATHLLPHYAPTYNLLAYYYATKGHNLKKAEEYVSKALSHDAKNPHILDTQAVIFYKQKEYTKADALFTAIRNQLTNDATVLIHHAKTLAALQKKNESLETLEQARIHARYEHEFKSLRKLQEKWQQKYGSLQASREDISSPA